MDKSFAITIDGMVFSWGNNNSHLLGHNINDNHIILSPKLIPQLCSIKSIRCSTQLSYNYLTCFLSANNMIYFCGKYIDNKHKRQIQMIPVQIPMKLNVQQFPELCSYYFLNPLIILNCNKICELTTPYYLKEYNYNNFNKYNKN